MSLFCGLGHTTTLAAKSMRPIEIKQGYREVLGVLAAGDLARAVEMLMEFEQTAVGGDKPWAHMDDFWRLKLRVLRDLLESQPLELLKPVIVLHHDAYFEYLRADRRHLAHHSRKMASELVEIFADRAGTPEAGLFGGWVLTSFAVHLWSPSSIGESADLFYRAQRIDSGNEIAVLGLSAAYERSGEYGKAIEYLQQALRIDPLNAEARLRLALCQLRHEGNRSEAATRRLTELTGRQSESWIRSVAFQELVRTRLQSGREDEAETLARQGLRELPGDQQLSLQLAFLLDRQRRRGDAFRVLDAVRADGWQQDSPRERYDVWMPEGVEEIRAALHAQMESGLVGLGAGLLVAPSEGVGR